MLKPQRRVFLKVIAAGPFVGCAGAGSGVEDGPPAGAGGSDAWGGAGTGNSSSAGNRAVGGGNVGAGSSSGGSSSAGSPFSNGGNATGGTFVNSGNTNSGGNVFGSGGQANHAGASAGGAASGGSVGIGSMNEHGTLVANVKDIAPGWFGIVGGLFFMGRDAGGIYAMSLQCTHKFCALVISGTILDCPCHHSHFDYAGKVLMGPATTPLPHFAIFVDEAGNIWVDKYTVVSATQRTPI